MTVSEFVRMGDATYYAIADATRTGYKSHPVILETADRNVCRNLYGDKAVVGFDIKNKTTMIVYVK